MDWARSRGAVAAGLLLAGGLAWPHAARALTQVSGPVQIGPSSGDGDAQNRSATLSTVVTNQGELPDRLVNVACPGLGTANLLNGQVQPVTPGSPAGPGEPRNGLDLPGAVSDRATPVPVRIGLSQATQPMLAGTLLPCSLYFEHAGQRIVVFMLGAHDPASNEP